MNTITGLDDDIPVLTEVISTDEKHVDNSTTAQLWRFGKRAADVQQQTEIQTDAPHQYTLEELEKTLRENVLHQLLARVNLVLEHRVNESLAQTLQTATDDLNKTIRQGLADTLEDIIRRAVSQELAKLPVAPQAIKPNIPQSTSPTS